MAKDLQQNFENLTMSTPEDQNVLIDFARRLTEVRFEGRTDKPEKIYEVLSRVVDLVSESSNKPKNIAQTLKIRSEKIFEYERFWKEFANGLKDLALHVNNHDFNKLMNIWEQLLKAANMSASADKQFLEKLKLATARITQNKTDIVEHLKEVGFDVNLRDDDQEPISLSKVFRLAVDCLVCSGRNINLANENFEDTKLRLEQMLLTKTTQTGQKKNIATSLDEVFGKQLTRDLALDLKSPKTIADKLGIKEETDTAFVTNLFEKQFSIQWNTEFQWNTERKNLAKEPEEFNLYTFYDMLMNKDETMEVRTKHFHYDPRRAHVMVQLYRFCRTKPRMEYSVKELCPPVYVRHESEWKEWDLEEKNPKPNSIDFRWMNPRDVYQCICSQAKEIKPNKQALKQALKQVLEKAFKQALKQAFKQALEQTPEQAPKQKFQQDLIKKDLKQALTQAFKKAFEQAYERKLKEAFKENLKKVLNQALEQAFKEGFQQALEQDLIIALEQALEKDSEQDLQQAFKQALNEAFKPALNQALEKAVEQDLKQAVDYAFKQALATPTLYWAVVQDEDFQSGDHLKLHDIGKTQVYVGKANNGIKARWLTDGDNHCTMMKKCLDNVQKMTTYDPLRLAGIQLVDARILLATLRKEKCALFVMNTYEEPRAIDKLETDEKANIKGKSRTGNKLLPVCQDWTPKDMAYGMNCRA